MSYNEILNSDKPDKEIEHFWLNFKDNLMRYFDDEEKREIALLSERLNKLQSEKEYKIIEKYIRLHLETIGYSMMSKGNSYNLHLLDTNLKRWKKISSENIMTNDNIFYCLFNIYIMVNENEKKNTTDGRIEISLLIKEYASTKNSKLLYDITSIAIKENYCGVLEKIRYVVDMTRFATDEGKQFFAKHSFNTMRAVKFIKYIKPNYD